MARIMFATNDGEKVERRLRYREDMATLRTRTLARTIEVAAFSTDDDWIDSLSERSAESARLQRLKSLQRNGQYLRKLLILLGLFVFASGLSLISSHFGDLTSSF